MNLGEIANWTSRLTEGAHQAPQVIQGHTAGPHQKGDEGMLQAGHAPSEVSLPGQFLVGGFALNVGLL